MRLLTSWKKNVMRFSLAVALGVGSLSVSTASAMDVKDLMNGKFSEIANSQAIVQLLPKGVEAFDYKQSHSYTSQKIAQDLQLAILKQEHQDDLALQDFMKRQERIKAEPEFFNYYQLQGHTREGLQTAHLVATIVDGPWIKDYSIMRDKEGVWHGMADMLGVSTTAAIADFDKVKEVLKEESIISNLVVRDLEMPKAVRGDNYHALTVGGRAHIDINGFEIPMYVKAATIGTEEKPTFLFLVTTDVEREFFSPVFDHVVKHYK